MSTSTATATSKKSRSSKRTAPRGVTKNVRRALDSGQSKSDLAQTLFAKHHGKMPRKDVIEKFVSGAGLTPAGAKTYYQKFLSEETGKGRRKGSDVHRSRGRPIDAASKAGKARELFKRMHGKPRKDVIEAFQAKLGLTPAGSSTYYQKIKTAA